MTDQAIKKSGPHTDQAIKKSGPHNMQKRFKRLPWLVCMTCGLVGLKNDATREALRKPCTWLEDR